MDHNKKLIEIPLVTLIISFIVFYHYRSVAPLKPGILQLHFDQLQHVWVFGWDSWAIIHKPLSIFHANIFYPAPNTLALADHLFGFLPLWFIGYLISHDFVEAHNYVFLFARIIGGVASYTYFRYCNFRIPSAFVGSTFFVTQLSPIMIDEIEFSCFGYTFLVFYFIDRYLDKGKIVNLIFLAISFTVGCLSGFYFAYMLIIAIGIFLVINLILDIKRLSFKKLFILATCFLLSLLTLIPTFYPYYKMQEAQIIPKPTIETIVGTSRSVDNLDFIFSVVLISIISIYLLYRKRSGNRGRVIIFLAIALTFHLLTLGPYLKIGKDVTSVPLPHLLFLWVPGFGSIRYFWIFRLMSHVGEAYLLSALLNSILTVKSKQVFTRRNKFPIIIFTLISIVSLYNIKTVYTFNIFSPVPVADNLPMIYKKLISEVGSGPVAEFPLETNMKFGGFIYQYFSLYHRRRIYNGSSAYLPPGYEIMLNADLSPDEWVSYFRTIGVKYIISHPSDFLARIIEKSSNYSDMDTPPLSPPRRDRLKSVILMDPKEKAIFINGLIQPTLDKILKKFGIPGIISALPTTNAGKDKFIIDLGHNTSNIRKPEKITALPEYMMRNNNILSIEYKDLERFVNDLGFGMHYSLIKQGIDRIEVKGYRYLFEKNIKNPFYGLSEPGAKKIGLSKITEAEDSIIWRIEPNNKIRSINMPDTKFSFAVVERDVVGIKVLISVPSSTAWKNPNLYGKNKGRIKILVEEKGETFEYDAFIEVPLAINDCRPYEAKCLVHVPLPKGICKVYIYFPDLMDTNLFLGVYRLK